MKKSALYILGAALLFFAYKRFAGAKKVTPALQGGSFGSGGLPGFGGTSLPSNTGKPNTTTTGGGGPGSGPGSGPGGGTGTGSGSNPLGALGTLIGSLFDKLKGNSGGGISAGAGVSSGASTKIPLPENAGKDAKPVKNISDTPGRPEDALFGRVGVGPYQEPTWKANQSGISDRYENPNPDVDPGGELEAGGSNPFEEGAAYPFDLTSGGLNGWTTAPSVDDIFSNDPGNELSPDNSYNATGQDWSNPPNLNGTFGGGFGGWDNSFTTANAGLPWNTWTNPNYSSNTNYNVGGGVTSFGGPGTNTGWQYNSAGFDFNNPNNSADDFGGSNFDWTGTGVGNNSWDSWDSGGGYGGWDNWEW